MKIVLATGTFSVSHANTCKKPSPDLKGAHVKPNAGLIKCAIIMRRSKEIVQVNRVTPVSWNLRVRERNKTHALGIQ